jgi:hypothetical protein
MWKVWVGFLLICFVAMQPSKTLSEAAFAVGEWGNGAWASGSAYNYRTQSEAAAAAMNSCNQRGYNCSIRTTFRKACFALASQDGGSGWQTGIHTDPDVANRYALVTCAKWGLQCTIREEYCDNVSEAEVLAAEQAEYQQYVQNWKGCFGQVAVSSSNEQINFCNSALSFSRASQDDRNNLVRQRSAVIAAHNQELANKAQAALNAENAANARAQEAFHIYELRWQHCFDLSAPVSRIDDQITSCDYALAYPRASADDRAKLIEHRGALIISRDQLAQDQTRRTQTTQQSSSLAQKEPLATDPHTYEKWDFSWLGLFAIISRLHFFSIGAFVTIVGWSALAGRGNAVAFTKNEVRKVMISSGALLAAGMLLGFLQNRVSSEYAGILSLGSFMLEVFGNSLVALATGAWVSSRFFNPKSRVPLRALIPIWLVVAATWIALLSSHAVYASQMDAWIIVRLAFAWTFVLGYLLCDPFLNPFVYRLNNRVQLFLSKAVALLSRLRSLQPAKTKPTVWEYDELGAYSGRASSTIDVKIKLSQRSNFWGRIIFMLDARMETPATDYAEIQKYGLGNDVIYDSIFREKHMEKVKQHLDSTKQQPGLRDPLNKQLLGGLKTLFRLMLAIINLFRMKLALRITVKKLMHGVHVESKSLKEITEVECAIIDALENLRAYLVTANKYDGRERVHAF